MAELYRHTDNDGDLVEFIEAGGMLMVRIRTHHALVSAVLLPDAAGRELTAALQQHYDGQGASE